MHCKEFTIMGRKYKAISQSVGLISDEAEGRVSLPNQGLK